MLLLEGKKTRPFLYFWGEPKIPLQTLKSKTQNALSLLIVHYAESQILFSLYTNIVLPLHCYVESC